MFSVIFSSTPPGVCQKKKTPSHFRPARSDENPNRILPLAPLRPNRSNSLNWGASRTLQPAMPSPLLSPLKFFLRLAHPVRNHKNTNQLLDSNAPALRQLLQFQEYSTIKHLHKFH